MSSNSDVWVLFSFYTWSYSFPSSFIIFLSSFLPSYHQSFFSNSSSYFRHLSFPRPLPFVISFLRLFVLLQRLVIRWLNYFLFFSYHPIPSPVFSSCSCYLTPLLPLRTHHSSPFLCYIIFNGIPFFFSKSNTSRSKCILFLLLCYPFNPSLNPSFPSLISPSPFS